MPADNPTIDSLKLVVRENPDEALQRLKQLPHLKKTQLNRLITEAIICDSPHKVLINYLIERNQTTPQELFIWLISNNHPSAFMRLLKLGYPFDPHCREKRYGYTPQEMALANGHYYMLSLITGDSLLFSFLKTKFTSLEIHTQLWLICRMRSLGLPVRAEGICHAVAIFGGQALLVDDATRFMRRTTLIKNTPYADLPGTLQQAAIRRANKENLSTTEQDYLDFIPFSVGIELTQSADYSDWDKALGCVTPSTLRLLKTLESVELEQEGGLALIDSQATVDIDLNHTQKLKDFLSTLAHHLDQCLNSDKQKQAVFIYCSNFKHAISLGYDIKKKRWYFVDANHKKVMVAAKSMDHLTALFKQAFIKLGEQRQSFKLTLFTTVSNQSAVEKAITPGWQTQCHHFFTPSRGAPLAYYLVSFGLPLIAGLALSLSLKLSPALALACSALIHPILAVILTVIVTLMITSLAVYLIYRLAHPTPAEHANIEESPLTSQDDNFDSDEPSIEQSLSDKKPATLSNPCRFHFFTPHQDESLYPTLNPSLS